MKANKRKETEQKSYIHTIKTPAPTERITIDSLIRAFFCSCCADDSERKNVRNSPDIERRFDQMVQNNNNNKKNVNKNGCYTYIRMRLLCRRCRTNQINGREREREIERKIVWNMYHCISIRFESFRFHLVRMSFGWSEKILKIMR